MKERKILLGNDAIAHGLVESSCAMATSYPGTPASEVMSSLMALKNRLNLKLHLEWSVNEKIAFEVAMANAFTGRRSAVVMKQVGLNVAADPLMSAAYTGMKGGFVLVSADDPGPHSSQTEQDSRFFAMMAKIPVFDPSSPEEARSMIGKAFEVSEKHEIPVMLRPTTRVCHARQDLEARDVPEDGRVPLFEKNPQRWAATPKFRLTLHRQLNDKIRAIAEDPTLGPVLENGLAAPAPDAETAGACVIASGAAFANAREILCETGLWQKVPVYRVPMPFPLSPAFIDDVLARFTRILVLEESYPVIELQLRERSRVFGRLSGTVPAAGELLPETVEDVIRAFFGLQPASRPAPAPYPGRRPTLCAGCPHRAAFFAIRKVFPKGIYPGDIGCYTLGINLGAVDTVHCMGASVSMAAGFYHAYKSSREDFPTICATIGDSTFYHAGIPALVNAVVQGARFVLVILDNSTTAMTGHQPTPVTALEADGSPAAVLSTPDLVRACGVAYVVEEDPYDTKAFHKALKDAGAHMRSPEGGVAVVIAKRPCLMDRRHAVPGDRVRVMVTEKCKGCDFCVKQFECPALQPQGEKQPIRIDTELCSGCGVCIDVCPHGALVAEENAPAAR